MGCIYKGGCRIGDRRRVVLCKGEVKEEGRGKNNKGVMVDMCKRGCRIGKRRRHGTGGDVCGKERRKGRRVEGERE